MTTDPRVDMISFTGSTAVGRAAMAAASATLKKVSISRILLQRDIADNFVAGLVEKSSAVRVGDFLDPETKVGAIISADHLTKIERHVAAARDASATLRIGGERLPSDGFFMGPTVVDQIDPSMPIASDEAFGPVVTVMTFETLDEAIDLANATTYGLSASVWSRDVDTAVGVGRGVRAGTVWVNTFMDGTPELPFGGFGQSGLGHSAVADYTEEKTLHVHQGSARAGGSRGPEANQKDREPAQGFEKRRRTESGGRVRPGR
jgi:acyl-CoA reductase-like NAD-dependent aldehyde dehydrogenase